MTQTLQEENRLFYSKMFKIGVPVLVQQMISVGLNLADTIMGGRLSDDALAAVGAANQIYFIFSVLIIGVLSGAAVYTVQFWGIRDLKSLRKILGIDYMVCAVLSVVTMALAYVAAPQLIGLFVSGSEVIELGTKYLRIALFSYGFATFSFSVIFNSRAIMQLKIPTIINAVAILINIILNYCLIYGKMGMPQLGVEGAAYATLTARILECAAMFIAVYAQKEHPLRAGLKELASFDFKLFTDVMKKAIPVMVNESAWALSMSLMNIAYGKISDSAFAIMQIAITIMDFFQTAYIGVGNASAVIVGESLGQGRKNAAYRNSERVMKVTFVINILLTVLLISSRGIIADIYNFEPEVSELLKTSLFVYSLSIFPRAYAYMIVCGILRSGGDTLFCMYVETGFNMLMQVPLAFFGVLVLNWSLPAVVILVSIPDFIKAGVCIARYRGRKWLNTVTDMEEVLDD